MKKIIYCLLFIAIIAVNTYAVSKIPYTHENLTREELDKTLESMERRLEFFFDDDAILATNSEIKNLTTIIVKRFEDNGLIVDIPNSLITDKVTGKEYRAGRPVRGEGGN